METALDASLRPDHSRTGIDDPVTEQKPTLTRCCSLALQLSPLTGQLGDCKRDHSTGSPGPEEPTVAIGTGVYFQKKSSPSVDSGCEISEFQNLFHLATVACEVESSIRHRQTLVTKRRTPRKVLWINGSSSVTNGNCRNVIPAAGTPEVVKRQSLTGNLTAGHSAQPSWFEESLQDISAFTSKRTCTNMHSSSNTVILKFNSQHGVVGKKIIACPPNSSRINKLTKGKNRISSVLSKRRGPRMPGKNTRVQGIAKKILQFIGDGSTAEKFIRGAFGNNPDTSKSLRLLLTEHKVYRIGDGGRGKAFLYVATPAGLRELEEIKNNHDVIDHDSAKSHRPNHHEGFLTE